MVNTKIHLLFNNFFHINIQMLLGWLPAWHLRRGPWEAQFVLTLSTDLDRIITYENDYNAYAQ